MPKRLGTQALTDAQKTARYREKLRALGQWPPHKVRLAHLETSLDLLETRLAALESARPSPNPAPNQPQPPDSDPR